MIHWLRKKPVERSSEIVLMDKDKFYQSSSDWFYDIFDSQRVRLRWALLALVVITILLLFSMLTNILLMPLKRIEPYLYAFNNTTGEVTKLGKLEPTSLVANWQITRFFLTRYVMDREGYDFNNLDYPYQVVQAMTDEQIKKQYTDTVSSDNQNSPYRKYFKDKYITVNVRSINQLNDDTAEVHFDKILHDRNSNLTQTSSQVSIVKWKYTQLKETQRMLDQNPLGFQVKYYQRSPVTLNDTL